MIHRAAVEADISLSLVLNLIESVLGLSPEERGNKEEQGTFQAIS